MPMCSLSLSQPVPQDTATPTTQVHCDDHSLHSFCSLHMVHAWMSGWPLPAQYLGPHCFTGGLLSKRCWPLLQQPLLGCGHHDNHWLWWHFSYQRTSKYNYIKVCRTMSETGSELPEFGLVASSPGFSMLNLNIKKLLGMTLNFGLLCQQESIGVHYNDCVCVLYRACTYPL